MADSSWMNFRQSLGDLIGMRGRPEPTFQRGTSEVLPGNMPDFTTLPSLAAEPAPAPVAPAAAAPAAPTASIGSRMFPYASAQVADTSREMRAAADKNDMLGYLKAATFNAPSLAMSAVQDVFGAPVRAADAGIRNAVGFNTAYTPPLQTERGSDYYLSEGLKSRDARATQQTETAKAKSVSPLEKYMPPQGKVDFVRTENGWRRATEADYMPQLMQELAMQKTSADISKTMAEAVKAARTPSIDAARSTLMEFIAKQAAESMKSAKTPEQQTAVQNKYATDMFKLLTPQQMQAVIAGSIQD